MLVAMLVKRRIGSRVRRQRQAFVWLSIGPERLDHDHTVPRPPALTSPRPRAVSAVTDGYMCMCKAIHTRVPPWPHAPYSQCASQRDESQPQARAGPRTELRWNLVGLNSLRDLRFAAKRSQYYISSQSSSPHERKAALRPACSLVQPAPLTSAVRSCAFLAAAFIPATPRRGEHALDSFVLVLIIRLYFYLPRRLVCRRRWVPPTVVYPHGVAHSAFTGCSGTTRSAGP